MPLKFLPVHIWYLWKATGITSDTRNPLGKITGTTSDTCGGGFGHVEVSDMDHTYITTSLPKPKFSLEVLTWA